MHYSIVMPAYNVEAYIEDAVSDIEKQSFADFELILPGLPAAAAGLPRHQGRAAAGGDRNLEAVPDRR